MRKFSPLSMNHPSIGEPCAACKKSFAAGDVTTLVTLDPGDDEDAQAKARAGRAYNAVAAHVHWACAGVQEEEPDAAD